MIEQKVVLITGAADPRGIGFACARALARAGARVCITDLAGDQLERSIAQVTREFPERADGFALDVREETAFAAAVARVVDRFGRLDVLVNNAGTGAGTGRFLATTGAEWRDSWEVNVMGIVHGCRAALPPMLAQGAGSIVNMASVSGIGANALYGAYAATKHAVVGLTRTLAAEFASGGVRINAVCPGIVDTAMNDAQIEMLGRHYGIEPDAMRARMQALPAARRFAQPAEIAACVLFLASDAASYVTGASLPVAGGLPRGL